MGGPRVAPRAGGPLGRANAGLFAFDLATEELRPLVDTDWVETAPALYGDRLFYAANVGRVWSIYAYSLSTHRIERLTRQGFARAPAYDPATGELYYLGLTSAGYDLYRKPEALRHAENVEPSELTGFLPSVPVADRPASPRDPATFRHGDYRDDLRTLAPAFHYPLYESDGGSERSGFVLAGSDAIGDWQYQTQFLYDSATELMTYVPPFQCRPLESPVLP
ncbi:MAG: TolB family protein, partial [Methanocella sp.]